MGWPEVSHPWWIRRRSAASEVPGFGERQPTGSNKPLPFYSWKGASQKNALWLDPSQFNPGVSLTLSSTPMVVRRIPVPLITLPCSPHTTAKARHEQEGEGPTFWLLHAAGRSGRWCHGDFCEVQDGRKRKQGKKMLLKKKEKMLLLTLQKNQHSTDLSQPSCPPLQRLRHQDSQGGESQASMGAQHSPLFCGSCPFTWQRRRCSWLLRKGPEWGEGRRDR